MYPVLHHNQTQSPHLSLSLLLTQKNTMKRKNKGKVYPSPSSSSSVTSPALPVSSSSSSDGGDVLSVLTLLPVAILALVSILSLGDREVLAYMITRSMKTPSFQLLNDSKKKPTKKLPTSKTQNHSNRSNHKVPIFDCDCFDCYRSYWFRWDSSPNRELIHQAIEAFEDHLSNGERSPSPSTNKKSARGKRKDKAGRRMGERLDFDVVGQLENLGLESPSDAPVPPEISEASVNLSHSLALPAVSPCDDVASPVVVTPGSPADGEQVVEKVKEEVETAVVVAVSRMTHAAVSNHHKGLTRKVLPDVLGLLNSRLWSLWSPNV